MQILCLPLCICMYFYSLKLEELLYDVYNDIDVVWNIRAQTFYIVNNVFCRYPSTCDHTPLLYYSNATLFLKTTLITPYSVSTYRQMWWWALCVVCILISLTLFIWDQSCNTARFVAETALSKFEMRKFDAFFLKVMPDTYWKFSENSFSLTPGYLLKHIEPQRLNVTACFRYFPIQYLLSSHFWK